MGVVGTTTKTDLYHEVRGQGPAVLMIDGATGDAGHFTRTAERLADEFTVVTYDRRGNSRSTAGGDAPGTATMTAQADDAASLIRAFGFSQAVVFGTSGGALVTLELLARDPAIVHGAVIHEPPLFSVLPSSESDGPPHQLLELAHADPRAAVEAFVKENSSEAAWKAIEPATRERMLSNGANLFGCELREFLSYAPDPDALCAAGVPVSLLRSRGGLPFAHPCCLGWARSSAWTVPEPCPATTPRTSTCPSCSQRSCARSSETSGGSDTTGRRPPGHRLQRRRPPTASASRTPP